MGIVWDKSNLLILETFGHNSVIFCSTTKFQTSDPPKLAEKIGVWEVNFYSKSEIKPFLMWSILYEFLKKYIFLLL